MLVKEWHSTKNRVPIASVSVSSRFKVWWQCSTPNCGNEWQCSVKSRYYNQSRCPICSKKERIKKLTLASLERSVAYRYAYLMKEWHPTKNGHLNAFEIYPYNQQKVWWQCEKGHEWRSSPAYRVSKDSKCPQCQLMKQKEQRIRDLKNKQKKNCE